MFCKSPESHRKPPMFFLVFCIASRTDKGPLPLQLRNAVTPHKESRRVEVSGEKRKEVRHEDDELNTTRYYFCRR